MKKVLIQSLLHTEIAAFGMLMLLFFINTNRPYLLAVPAVVTIGGYFVFKVLLRKLREKSGGKSTPLIVMLPILLGGIIALSVIGLLRFT